MRQLKSRLDAADSHVSWALNMSAGHKCVHISFSFLSPTEVVLPSPAGIEMEIVNSCEKNNGGCSHHCEHTTNGPLCSCNHGYRLQQDRKTCVGRSFFHQYFFSCVFIQTPDNLLPSRTNSTLPPQTATSVSAASPAAVTCVKTTPEATSAAAGAATDSIQTAADVTVRVKHLSDVTTVPYSLNTTWQASAV